MGYDGGDVFWFLVKVVDKIAGDTLSSVAHSYKPQNKENVGSMAGATFFHKILGSHKPGATSTSVFFF